MNIANKYFIKYIFEEKYYKDGNEYIMEDVELPIDLEDYLVDQADRKVRGLESLIPGLAEWNLTRLYIRVGAEFSVPASINTYTGVIVFHFDENGEIAKITADR